MATDAEIAWAAGLFEGEGCLTISGTQARLKLNMTDEDTMRRFFQIVGVGNFREERSHEKRGYKRQWEWYASSKADVKRVIEMFWPWLGERRRVRAAELLQRCQQPHGNSIKMRGNRNAAAVQT